MLEMLKKMSLEKLVELFELTTDNNDINIPTVRGWLMDEISNRNHKGFEDWLDSEYAFDHELRNYVLA